MTKRGTVRIAIAAALLGLGWSVGRAQSARPDFELLIDAPGGETSVTCTRGCALIWTGKQVSVEAKSLQTFKCSNQERCSATMGGWVAEKK